MQTDEKKPRAFCAHCGKKVYKELLKLIFIHPVICKGGLYACLYDYNYSNYTRGVEDKKAGVSKCEIAIKKEVALYHNTGLYNLVPVKNQVTKKSK